MRQDATRKHYRLIFHANDAGVSKRVDFESASFDKVRRTVRADRAKRSVSVWEDGVLRCSLVHVDGVIREVHRRIAAAENTEFVLQQAH